MGKGKFKPFPFPLSPLTEKYWDIWKFLKLEENDIFIDLSNYYIKEIDKILGILSQNVQGDIPECSSTN
ncbi:hypothetical protein GJB62_03780 [Nostoc sp. ATCC 53789]|nr:hypothetical protein GJB62_03780 [Nostoc sp. ATCC 53789]